VVCSGGRGIPKYVILVRKRLIFSILISRGLQRGLLSITDTGSTILSVRRSLRTDMDVVRNNPVVVACENRTPTHCLTRSHNRENVSPSNFQPRFEFHSKKYNNKNRKTKRDRENVSCRDRERRQHVQQQLVFLQHDQLENVLGISTSGSQIEDFTLVSDIASDSEHAGDDNNEDMCANTLLKTGKGEGKNN
jgi:hypothetical protein